VTIEANENAPIPKGLPKALAPWSRTFQDMPEAHLRLIGDLMGQLNALLQETFAIDAQSYGEFNGYDGMAVRGEIERLLPSEWLWRELAPAEFLRRFAERELLYHRPSFESPTDERTHLVAIDSGPDMLGRPRLVALAALLCLSAIARAQGAKLLWTAPQANVEGWQELVRRDNLNAFLLNAGPVSLEASRLGEMIRSLPSRRDDAERVLWTIGAAPLTPGGEAIETNQIVISERMVLSGEGTPAAEARVRLISHSGRQKETVLAFPKEEDCVSLLREPFRRTLYAIGPAADAPAGPRKRPLVNGEVNPFWAPQEVLLQAAGPLLLRTAEGVLALRIGAGRTLENPILMRLESYDNLLGIYWKDGNIILATSRKYNTFSTLRISRHNPYQAEGHTRQENCDIRLAEDYPIAVNKHPKSAIPPLIKAGRKFRLHALTAQGEHYVLDKTNAVPDAQLSKLPLIGCRGAWFFLKAGEPEATVLIARNLVTSQCVTFALPPQAIVRDLDDIVYWPDDLKALTSNSLLLARCEDGHWRGQSGRRNLATYDQFPSSWIDVDLSSLVYAVPLNSSVGAGQRWVVHLWSLYDQSIHVCSFDRGVAPEIKKLQTLATDALSFRSLGSPQERRLRMLLQHTYPLTWEADEKGYVTRIAIGSDTLYTVAPISEYMQSYDVGDFIGKAKCLSLSD
jgi:hypothetical protein